jgi:hypothetical protein
MEITSGKGDRPKYPITKHFVDTVYPKNWLPMVLAEEQEGYGQKAAGGGRDNV